MFQSNVAGFFSTLLDGTSAATTVRTGPAPWVGPDRRAGGALNWWSRTSMRLVEAVSHLQLLDDIRRERRVLATLDDRMLRDLGIDQATAQHESSRRWWDVPANRA